MTSRKVTQLRSAMNLRGVSTDRLATELGISVRSLYNLAAGNNRSQRARDRAENFLGLKIWTAATQPKEAAQK